MEKERIKVTFEDLSSGQKIIVNFVHDKEEQNLDFKIGYDPVIESGSTELGLSAFLVQKLLTNLQ
ncbi:MAG: hypothetical protein J6V44_12565 [Methanobrevibacter sp.]|nr:hypothetical protein [Methanobrevibacter sp.]